MGALVSEHDDDDRRKGQSDDRYPVGQRRLAEEREKPAHDRNDRGWHSASEQRASRPRHEQHKVTFRVVADSVMRKEALSRAPRRCVPH